MKLCDKLVMLRKEKGYSQENLANQLGVSRQSVSKWEADAAMPEIGKLIMISDIFEVSLDFLLRDELETREYPSSNTREDGRIEEQLKEINQYIKKERGYEYISKTKIGKLPLVHVNIGNDRSLRRVAKGVIAIGNVSFGIVSIGGLSVGILSMGGSAIGAISIAGAAFGLLSFGAAAIGVVSFGVASLGLYSVGVAAMGKELAVGVSAVARTAVGIETDGINCLNSQTASAKEIVDFIGTHCREIPGFILRLVRTH